MMTDAEFMQEIRDLVVETIDADRPAPMPWLVQELCARHADVHGADADWYRRCAHRACDAAVRRAFSECKKPTLSANPMQEKLPGFKHLQRYYPVRRDGTSTFVGIEHLTRDEIIAKADEYRRMAIGCNDHADELIEFLDARAVVDTHNIA